MSAGKTIGKSAATGGLLIAACVACCAPLIAPWVIGIIAAGGASLALIGQVGLALALVAGTAVYLWSRSRRRATTASSQNAPQGGCGCAPDAGCNVGDACELPSPASKPSLLQRVKSLC